MNERLPGGICKVDRACAHQARREGEQMAMDLSLVCGQKTTDYAITNSELSSGSLPKAHGGSIGCVSKVHKGSNFWFRLPAQQPYPELC